MTSLSRPVTCAILAMAGSGHLVACTAPPADDSESVSSRVSPGGDAVQAKPADAFVDTTCVATHFTYYDTVYGSRYAEVRDKLFALGARHVREGGDGEAAVAKMRELAAGGVTTIFVMDPNGGVKPSHDYWSNPNKDERPNPAKDDNEAHFGLLRNDLSEKPAYKALKNMNAVLSDRGGNFTPGSLAYSLSGNTDGVERVLLQKRDGRFFLALWIEEASYEPNTGARIDVPDRGLTVTLPASIATATLHALNDDGEMMVSAGDLADGKLRLTVTDRITLVELAPAGGGAGGGGGGDVSEASKALNACVARNGGPAAAGAAVDSGGGAGVHRWGSGDVQDFAGGSFGPTICMLRDNSDTAWMVRGAIRDAYFAAGGAAGWLGYPVEDEHGSNRGALQRFENGYITQDGAHFAAFAGSP